MRSHASCVYHVFAYCGIQTMTILAVTRKTPLCPLFVLPVFRLNVTVLDATQETKGGKSVLERRRLAVFTTCSTLATGHSPPSCPRVLIHQRCTITSTASSDVSRCLHNLTPAHSLHRRAYKHKTCIILEHMLTDALVAANDFILIPSPHGPKRMSEAIDDMVSAVRVCCYHTTTSC